MQMTALHGENFFGISKLVYSWQNLGDGFSTVCMVKFDEFLSIQFTLPVEKDDLGVSSAFFSCSCILCFSFCSSDF